MIQIASVKVNLKIDACIIFETNLDSCGVKYLYIFSMIKISSKIASNYLYLKISSKIVSNYLYLKISAKLYHLNVFDVFF